MFDADQLRVVNHENGALLVVAGAGSGKTTAVVGRAVRLIQEGLSPRSHLMLTFTRKAAEEMRQRIAQELPGIDASRLPIFTFHGFCWKLIHKHPAMYGFLPGVTLLSDDDVLSILVQIAKRRGLWDEAKKSSRDLLGDIHKIKLYYSKMRNDGVNVQDRNEVLLWLEDDQGGEGKRILPSFMACALAYEDYKARTNTIDFDDVISVAVHTLAKEELLRKAVQRQFAYLTVDEGQDTNYLQYQLLQLLVGEAKNVVLVGDDDQAIYAWRGARPQNLMDFLNAFDASRVYLTNNYRSQQRIVEAAGAHISHNKERFEKNPTPIRAAADPVFMWEAANSYQAANNLVQQIRQDLANGVKPTEIAVLFRSNQGATLLREALNRANLPFHVVNGVEALSTDEHQLVLALCRLAGNPRDVRALERVVTMFDTVSFDDIQALADFARESDAPVLSALPHVTINKDARATLENLNNYLFVLRNNGPEALRDVLPDVGFWDYFEKTDPEPVVTELRRANIAEMLEQIDIWLDGREMSITEQWNEIQYAFLIEAKHADCPDGRIWLSTIHQAKGLEWDTVHVWGLSEHLFPIYRGNLEEERRLSYVGLTRAKNKCHLWHASEYADREGKFYKKSKFMSELPAHHVQKMAFNEDSPQLA